MQRELEMLIQLRQIFDFCLESAYYFMTCFFLCMKKCNQNYNYWRAILISLVKFDLILIDEASAQAMDYFASRREEGTIQYGYWSVWSVMHVCFPKHSRMGTARMK